MSEPKPTEFVVHYALAGSRRGQHAYSYVTHGYNIQEGGTLFVRKRGHDISDVIYSPGTWILKNNSMEQPSPDKPSDNE